MHELKYFYPCGKLRYEYMRDNNGNIINKPVNTKSLEEYNAHLTDFIFQHKYNMERNKPLKTIRECNYDFIINKRNERKQKAILKHKKLQSTW